jgi:hypothetical protein
MIVWFGLTTHLIALNLLMLKFIGSHTFLYYIFEISATIDYLFKMSKQDLSNHPLIYLDFTFGEEDMQGGTEHQKDLE